MKCDACGGPMISARENYNYAACGLPHVTLVGVEVRRCKACGEHEVVLPKIEQLHRAIALGVVAKRPRRPSRRSPGRSPGTSRPPGAWSRFRGIGH